MKNQKISIGDMRITFSRNISGNTVATVRLLTSAEIRFHRVILPLGTPAYALYENVAQEAIKRLVGVSGSEETTLRCEFPV